MFGGLSKLGVAVRNYLSKYAVGSKEPALAFDFVNGQYRTNNTTQSPTVAFNHARSGNATMVDSDGLLKWAPHNLLSYSEDFSNAIWNPLNASIDSNVTTSPNGSITASKIVESSATGAHALNRSSAVANIKQTYSVYAKQAERSQIAIQLGAAASYFDLASGSVLSGAGQIQSVGDGWYKCSLSGVPSNNNSIIYMALSGSVSYAGDGSSGVYLWGAHLYRSDLGGMVNNPETGDSYVRTAGRAISSELVTNGTFDTDTDWTKVEIGSSTVTISGGVAELAVDGSGSFVSIDQVMGLVTGKTYVITFDANTSAGTTSLVIALGTTGAYFVSSGNTPSFGTSTETISATFVASGPGIRLAREPNGSATGETITIDNISVKEIDVDPSQTRYLPRIGNHVYNGSAWVNEGLLHESESRTNLWPVSEVPNGASDFDTKAGLLSYGSYDFGPLGTTTGVSFGHDGATLSYAYKAYTTTGSHTLSVFVSMDDENGPPSFGSSTNASSLNDFALASESDVINPTSYTVEQVGENLYKVSGTRTNTGVSGNYGVVKYAGNTSRTFKVTGFQLEAATTPSSYIPTSGSTATRAADTITVPSASLPWPTPEYISDELVTNGTFDTDLTGWSIGGTDATHTVTYSSGGARYQSDTTSPVLTLAQGSILTIGKTYAVTVETTAFTSGSLKTGSFSTAYIVSSGLGAITFYGVASSEALTIVRNSTNVDVTIDNISVREINPLSVSIQMDGTMTYADDDIDGLAVRLVEWQKDNQNRIISQLVTSGALTGQAYFFQEAFNVADFVAEDVYSSGTNVPFNFAGRHGSTFLNGAVDGVALTANTTPTALPDLSATDLDLAPTYMGNIGKFRVWSQDLGDDGIAEATAPSLEPSLSLTFDGSESSFVVGDWT